jgi:phage tail tape-measure protein
MKAKKVVMKAKKKSKGVSGKAGKGRVVHEAEGGASGALAGAVLGAGAGPPGIVAGAIIGGVVGTLAGAALDSESSRKSSRTRELDAEIGVSKGELGAPNLEHPPAKIGAYSAASSGVASSSGEDPAEGPMQQPEK